MVAVNRGLQLEEMREAQVMSDTKICYFTVFRKIEKGDDWLALLVTIIFKF